MLVDKVPSAYDTATCTSIHRTTYDYKQNQATMTIGKTKYHSNWQRSSGNAMYTADVTKLYANKTYRKVHVIENLNIFYSFLHKTVCAS